MSPAVLLLADKCNLTLKCLTRTFHRALAEDYFMAASLLDMEAGTSLKEQHSYWVIAGIRPTKAPNRERWGGL